MRYYDIHTHQDRFTDKNVVSIVSVEVIPNLNLQETEADLWFSAGIHPWKMRVPASLPGLIGLLADGLKDQRMVAIGECGLDRYTGQPMNDQIKIFEAQIELSETYKRPLIVHCVKAFDELIGLHKSIRPRQPWIIHGFRGKIQQALQLQDNDFYLSFGKYFYHNIFTSVDMRRILLETDASSDLSIKEVYERVAESMSLPTDELSAQIEKNVGNVFPAILPV